MWSPFCGARTTAARRTINFGVVDAIAGELQCCRSLTREAMHAHAAALLVPAGGEPPSAEEDRRVFTFTPRRRAARGTRLRDRDRSSATQPMHSSTRRSGSWPRRTTGSSAASTAANMPAPPPSPASDALADACVRSNRITTEVDARARRIAGLSLGGASVAASALWAEPHLGLLGLMANASLLIFARLLQPMRLCLPRRVGD